MDGDLAYAADVDIAFQNKIVLILLSSTITLSLQTMDVLLVSDMSIISLYNSFFNFDFS